MENATQFNARDHFKSCDTAIYIIQYQWMVRKTCTVGVGVWITLVHGVHNVSFYDQRISHRTPMDCNIFIFLQKPHVRRAHSTWKVWRRRGGVVSRYFFTKVAAISLRWAPWALHFVCHFAQGLGKFHEKVHSIHWMPENVSLAPSHSCAAADVRIACILHAFNMIVCSILAVYINTFAHLNYHIICALDNQRWHRWKKKKQQH